MKAITFIGLVFRGSIASTALLLYLFSFSFSKATSYDSLSRLTVIGTNETSSEMSERQSVEHNRFMSEEITLDTTLMPENRLINRQEELFVGTLEQMSEIFRKEIDNLVAQASRMDHEEYSKRIRELTERFQKARLEVVQGSLQEATTLRRAHQREFKNQRQEVLEKQPAHPKKDAEHTRRAEAYYVAEQLKIDQGQAETKAKIQAENEARQKKKESAIATITGTFASLEKISDITLEELMKSTKINPEVGIGYYTYPNLSQIEIFGESRLLEDTNPSKKAVSDRYRDVPKPIAVRLANNSVYQDLKKGERMFRIIPSAKYHPSADYLRAGLYICDGVVNVGRRNLSGSVESTEMYQFHEVSENPKKQALQEKSNIEIDDNRKTGESKTVELSGGVSLEMVWCSSGSFRMGQAGAGNRPTQLVELSKGFWIGKFEVTREQWRAVMGENSLRMKDQNIAIDQNFHYTVKPPGYEDTTRMKWEKECPIVFVSWNDAQEFIQKVNSLVVGLTFRLPTEAEWEYACRAGTESDFSGEVDAVCWHSRNSKLPLYPVDTKEAHPWAITAFHPVGTKEANPWGIHDMHGNVAEWCQDWWFACSKEAVKDPVGPSSGKGKVVRGGSFDSNASSSCRSFDRKWRKPTAFSGTGGFRLAGESSLADN